MGAASVSDRGAGSDASGERRSRVVPKKRSPEKPGSQYCCGVRRLLFGCQNVTGSLVFQESVSRSEDTRLNSSHDQISYAVFCLKKKKQLINLLTYSLSHESRNPSSTKRYSQLLIRLGEDDLARSTYLSSRATYLKQQIRAMQHPGAYGASVVNSLVQAIAWIVVLVIKNSWGLYNQVLADSRTASSLFQWCKEQV